MKKVVALLALVAAVSCAPEVSPTSPPPSAQPGVPASIELAVLATSGTNRATVSARVLDAFSTAVPSVLVHFETNSGTLNPSEGTSNDAGRVVSELVANPGSVRVTASTAAGPSSTTLVAIQ